MQQRSIRPGGAHSESRAVYRAPRSRVLRASSLLLYSGVAALGEALIARPALLFLRGLGIFRAVLPWRVPFGAVQLALALAVALCTLCLGVRAALEKPPRLPLHAALLALLALSFAVRRVAEPSRPPADPLPALLTGLRTAAGAIARGQDGAALDAELAGLDPPGFVRFGRQLPMRAALVAGATGPLPDGRSSIALDEPGTVCIARDEKAAWLTVRTLNGFAALPDGQPAVIEVRGGARSEPGRDPLLPAYPGMRSITRRN